ncbi:response regulator [Aquincola sp. S2]|uniref:Response regulator n=1 Tax=Pseudaquabacterium terrae TaxID=2732868 RepID=A0ABX2ES83_9BURK|nr:response regulator [Aquabacterium terrae]NRF71612.1 response regulator [Aquabacterium terrae]
MPDLSESTLPESAELRVLIVDDDPDVADALAGLLELMGCRTTVAFGGESGLRMLQLFKPGLVFLDLGMPGYDGVGVMHRAKTFGQADGAMYVCLTGNKYEEDRALASGFDRFVHKPMTMDKLSEILSEARARSVVQDHWRLKSVDGTSSAFSEAGPPMN